MAFTLRSPAFDDGGEIPVVHSCDGDERPPDLAWSGAPDGTMSFVLVMHDPDSPKGDFVHWVLFDIPPHTTHISAADESVEAGTPGTNSFLNMGYGGPCPPPGSPPHHYHFELHALSVTTINVDDAATRDAVENGFQGHVLATARLVGTYQREG